MQLSVPLRVTDLVKTYRTPGKPPLEAVKGVSFEVASGECLGLLGPNGAGKSTTMKCITGFFQPTCGEVTILGHDVHRDPREARRGLGVCAQDDNLDTDFSVLDQMVQFGVYFGINRREGERRSLELLRRFGLLDKKDELVEELSGGMRRRLQVARSLINQPKVLVLDEPTTGLDPEARRVLWDILAEERRKGLAILLSTHYMEEAERLCDRVAIIHLGKIVTVGDPRALIEREMGSVPVREEIRPGFPIERLPNLEDVYLKLTGARLSTGVAFS
ncbi:MAG: ABC transporter ATP-binding protein [Oligoflexia bacterium]|nr:ABC transporter ATP-binding protein [Oligoflexia bacterium]